MKIFSKIKKWFRNLLIKNKILTIYIPLIIIPIFLLGYISNYFYTQSIIDKTIKNVQEDSNLIITRIEAILTNTESCADITTLDINRNVFKTQDSDVGVVLNLDLRNEIEDQLNYSILIFKEVESIAFIDDNSNLYFPNNFALRKLGDSFEKAEQGNILQEIRKHNSQNIWFPFQVRDYLTLDKNAPVLTLGKRIINIKTGSSLGTLILNIKEDTLSSIYKDIGNVGQRNSFIVDEQGKIISSLNKQELLKTIKDYVLLKEVSSKKTFTGIEMIDGKKTLVTSLPFKKMKWKMVNEIPLNQLTKDTQKITYLIIILGLFCMFLGLLGAGILSKVIANPLVHLTNTMSEIRDDNLTVIFEIDSSDEVGTLAYGFNTMIHRVKGLLSDIKIEQKKKREFELALIQAQIKPHFLYNTLDVIYTLSKMGREKEVQKATKSLADFYRIALNKGNEVVTIEEEIKNVTAYLSIQRIRYSDIFDFEIEMEEEILQHEILKLTVQPLVENSIYHGLKTKGSFGKILITGHLKHNIIEIKVIDNGVGIPVEVLEGLFNKNSLTKEIKNSFGLSSVHDRIKLYFGDEYGIKVESEVGVRTEITIHIPALRKDSE